jgi:hypothetical protein
MKLQMFCFFYILVSTMASLNVPLSLVDLNGTGEQPLDVKVFSINFQKG